METRTLDFLSFPASTERGGGGDPFEGRNREEEEGTNDSVQNQAVLDMTAGDKECNHSTGKKLREKDE